MGEDAVCAALYRARATELRAEASKISKPRERERILASAEEYDWRAACVEAAIALGQAPLASEQLGRIAT